MPQDRIVIDPNVLVGKPVVKGTRIPVAVVLEYLASDLDLRTLFEAFPRLTEDDVKACLNYARAVISGEDVFPACCAHAAEPLRSPR